MAGDKKEKKKDKQRDGQADVVAEDEVLTNANDEKKASKAKMLKVELTPKRTPLGDSPTIKRLLDDAAIYILLDDEDGHGYVEDTSMSNLKLIVGFAGVGASLISHVYPGAFPKNWWALLLCCAFYFAMSGILQLLLSFVELESIIVVNGKTLPDGSRRPSINVSSHFPRFQEMYTIGITPVPGGALALYSAPRFRPDVPGGNTAAGCLQRSWSVEQFFDAEGLFYEEVFMAAVKEFVAEYGQMVPDAASKKQK